MTGTPSLLPELWDKICQELWLDNDPDRTPAWQTLHEMRTINETLKTSSGTYLFRKFSMYYAGGTQQATSGYRYFNGDIDQAEAARLMGYLSGRPTLKTIYIHRQRGVLDPSASQFFLHMLQHPAVAPSLEELELTFVPDFSANTAIAIKLKGLKSMQLPLYLDQRQTSDGSIDFILEATKSIHELVVETDTPMYLPLRLNTSTKICTLRLYEVTFDGQDLTALVEKNPNLQSVRISKAKMTSTPGSWLSVILALQTSCPKLKMVMFSENKYLPGHPNFLGAPVQSAENVVSGSGWWEIISGDWFEYHALGDLMRLINTRAKQGGSWVTYLSRCDALYSLAEVRADHSKCGKERPYEHVHYEFVTSVSWP